MHISLKVSICKLKASILEQTFVFSLSNSSLSDLLHLQKASHRQTDTGWELYEDYNKHQ